MLLLLAGVLLMEKLNKNDANTKQFQLRFAIFPE